MSSFRSSLAARDAMTQASTKEISAGGRDKEMARLFACAPRHYWSD